MEQIGRYEIERELGRGAMGVVYLAHDPYIKRPVAIKVLPPQFTIDAQFRERFQREAQMIASLEHPAIVPVHDFGQHQERPYLVMRYMSGGSLRDRMDGPLPLSEIIAILVRLAPALDKAHDRGIIHRDLKPANVLFDEDDQPYLADFGIARLAAATHTMTIAGTPVYMSPEQVQGDQILDGRSDIYALGVMLFEMLSGRPPYEADTPTKLMMKHVLEPVPNIRDVKPDLPDACQPVIERVMAKDREKRYPTTMALARAVQQLAPPARREQAPDPSRPAAAISPTSATGAAPGEAPGPAAAAERRKRRWPAWTWGLAVVFVLALIIWAVGKLSDQFRAAATPAAMLTGEPTTMPEVVEDANEAAPGVNGTEEAADVAAAGDRAVPPASATLHDTWARPADRMVMVYVPPGTFTMGSEAGDPDAQDDAEFPAHRVSLDGFWLDRSEVTNAQYRLCVADGRCRASSLADDPVSNGSDYPVVGVSWNDATDYCAWAGAQLPTEAQWEFAARGEESRIYPWGDEAPTCELARFADCAGRAVPVGSYSPAGDSWAGAVDMAGNVWEWVADWYHSDYYETLPSPAANPRGPETGEAKVFRGGSWNDDRRALRGANRAPLNPDNRSGNSVGFRCASVPGS